MLQGTFPGMLFANDRIFASMNWREGFWDSQKEAAVPSFETHPRSDCGRGLGEYFLEFR